MIVYGWGYYNKRDSRYTQDTCDNCGHHGYMHSYNCSRFFTIYFTPIIPLGGLHRHGECPICKVARQMSLGQWKKIVKQELEPAIADYMNHPSDSEKAKKAIAACGTLVDRDALIEVAVLAEQHLGRDAEVMTGLGWAYGGFDMDDQAVDAFHKSLKVKDDDDVRQALAVHHIYAGRPEEATDIVSDLLNTRGEEVAALRIIEAQAWQGLGKHEEALIVIEDLEQRFPTYEATAVANLRRLSEQCRETQRPVGPRATPRRQPRQPNWLLQKVPLLVLPAIIFAIFAIYALVAINARPDHVYLVNGLDQPYRVLVNGRSIEVRANQERKINVPYGTITIAPAPGDIPIDAATYDLSPALWSRGYADPTLIINPDRLAMILWEDRMYHENLSRARAPNEALHITRTFYRFDGIHFHFRHFPSKVESSSASEVRTAVQLLEDWTIVDRLDHIFETQGTEAAIEATLRFATFDPESDIAPLILANLVEPTTFIEFAEPFLEERPLMVEWHRAYQSLMENVDPETDLVSQYKRIYEQHPDDPAAAYLYGRTHDDPAASYPFYEQSIAGPNPSMHGYNALAYGYLRDGRFADALEMSRQAVTLGPTNENVTTLHDDILVANRRFDELISAGRRAVSEDPTNFFAVNQLAMALYMNGDTEEADGAINRCLRQLQKQGGDDDTYAMIEQLFELLTAEYAGSLDDFANVSEKLGAVFQAHLARNNLEDAAAMLEDPAEDFIITPEDHLQVYILAMRANDATTAQRHINAAISQYRAQNTKAGRHWADWFSNNEQPPRTLTHYVNTPTSELPLPLTALGLHRPQDRDWLFELARKLNYRPDFPAKLLDQVLNEQ